MHKLTHRLKNKAKRVLGMKSIQVPTSTGHSRQLPLRTEDIQYLTASNPILLDLKLRYQNCDLPMAAHSWWNETRTRDDLELAWFRGDNAYVWQTRHMGQEPDI